MQPRSRRRLPSTAHGHPPGKGLVGEHHPVVDQDVVGVELARHHGLDLGQIPERAIGVAVLVTEDHQDPARQPEGLQGGDGRLGARHLEGPGVHQGHPALGGPVRQGRAEGQLDHLLRGLLGVGPRLGTEGHTAPDPLGRTGRALAGPTGPLLAEGLGPTAPDLGPGLRRLGAGSGGGQLGGHHLVEHGQIGLDPEDRGHRDPPRRARRRRSTDGSPSAAGERGAGSGGSRPGWPSPGRWSR